LPSMLATSGERCAPFRLALFAGKMAQSDGWRKIFITLKSPRRGFANAWFHQLSCACVPAWIAGKSRPLTERPLLCLLFSQSFSLTLFNVKVPTSFVGSWNIPQISRPPSEMTMLCRIRTSLPTSCWLIVPVQSEFTVTVPT
jgi:hypothetical protein